jgi:hypothetical protein
MWFTRRDPRVRDEIRYHRERLIEDYVASGLPRAEAERRAFLELGNPLQIEEAVRDVRGRWFDDFWRDLRYAFRTLRRERGFAAVAVLSLALGIGANTAIFSLLNALVLRTLAVPEAHQLVQFSYTYPGPGPNNWNSWMGYPHFERFRAKATTFSGVFGSVPQSRLNLAYEQSAGLARGEFISANYFSVLGISPQHGRFFAEEEDRADRTVAILSDRYWKDRFHSDRSIIGKSAHINRVPFTVNRCRAGRLLGDYRGECCGSVDSAPHARSPVTRSKPLDAGVFELDAHRRSARAWSVPRTGPS